MLPLDAAQEFARRLLNNAMARTSEERELILHIHGLLTAGKPEHEAFVLMKHLLAAAEIDST